MLTKNGGEKMNNDIVTIELPINIGFRELKHISEVLNAYVNNPYDMEETPERIVINLSSDCAFIENEDYQMYMVNNQDRLEQWVTCDECDYEAFKSDISFEQSLRYDEIVKEHDFNLLCYLCFTARLEDVIEELEQAEI
jgi:hypothetical protein